MLGSVVEEVCCSDVLVFVIVYDGRFKEIEGEEVEDLLCCWILWRCKY
jgi:hypothetical protein